MIWKNLPSFLLPPAQNPWEMRRASTSTLASGVNVNVTLPQVHAQPVSKHSQASSLLPQTSPQLYLVTRPTITQEPDICVCGCQYGSCIPQRRYANSKNDPISDSERGTLITFSVNGKCGFPVRRALEKRYAGLDGRDDHMFVGFRSAIAVRFEVRETACKVSDSVIQKLMAGLYLT